MAKDTVSGNGISAGEDFMAFSTTCFAAFNDCQSAEEILDSEISLKNIELPKVDFNNKCFSDMVGVVKDYSVILNLIEQGQFLSQETFSEETALVKELKETFSDC